MLIQELDEQKCIANVGLYGVCEDCGLCWMSMEEIDWYIIAAGLLEPIYIDFEFE